MANDDCSFDLCWNLLNKKMTKGGGGCIDLPTSFMEGTKVDDFDCNIL